VPTVVIIDDRKISEHDLPPNECGCKSVYVDTSVLFVPFLSKDSPIILHLMLHYLHNKRNAKDYHIDSTMEITYIVWHVKP